MSVAILMYHRVAELEPDTHRLCISPREFRRHMEWVARAREPRPLSALDAASDAHQIAVTLDDGTADALTAAAILDEVGVPATFFVSGAHLDAPHESWWDTLERIFLGGAELPERFRHAPFELHTRSETERRQAHEALRARLLTAGADARAALLALVADWSGLDLTPRASHRQLLADELLRLAQRFPVGAHGLSHLHLPSLSAADRRAELAGSRAGLESRLQRPVTELAYAYGACDESIAELAGELGFTCAVTVENRALRPGDDRLRLPRIAAQELTLAELAAQLT